jgi:hypothetical protein
MKLSAVLSDKGKDYFYIMHLSYNGSRRKELWEYASKENLIGLDAPRIVRENWIDARKKESVRRQLGAIWIRQFDTFCFEMGVGDIVLVLSGWDSLLGIAEIVKREHKYDKELSASERFFDHVRHVKWVKKYEYDKRQMLPEPLVGFNNTLSKITPHSPRWLILTNLNVMC